MANIKFMVHGFWEKPYPYPISIGFWLRWNASPENPGAPSEGNLAIYFKPWPLRRPFLERHAFSEGEPPSTIFWGAIGWLFQRPQPGVWINKGLKWDSHVDEATGHESLSVSQAWERVLA